MYCPKCGTFNPDGSRFCESCGSPLSASSPAPSGDETVLLSPQKSAVSPSSDDKTILLTPSENIATPPVPPRSQAPASSPAFQPASVQRTQPQSTPNQKPGNPAKPAKSENPPKTAKPHKGKKALVWVLVILLVLAGLGVGSWFGWNAYQGGQYQEQLSLGEKYLKELNYEDAIVALNRAIEIDPRSPEPYLLLADVYIEQEDFDSAKKTLEEGYKATGGNEEIKKKQEEVKQKEEEAKKQAEEAKKKEEAEKAAAAVPAAVVEYKGCVYYWQYNASSFKTPTYFFGRAIPQTETENHLVCRKEDGTETIIYSGPGSGSLCIVEDHIYFTRIQDYGHHIASVYRMDLNGQDQQHWENVAIMGTDPDTGSVICCSDTFGNGLLYALRTDGTLQPLTKDSQVFIAADHGYVYFNSYNRRMDGYIEIQRVSLESQEISTVYSKQLSLQNTTPTEIQCFQILGDTLYFSYGTGTSENRYLNRVSLDGSGFELLASCNYSSFYVYQEEGTDYMVYGTAPWSDNSSQFVMNLSTRETKPVSSPVVPAGFLSIDLEGNCWGYPDPSSAEPTLLINGKSDYTASRVTSSTEDYTPGEIVERLEEVTLCGDRVYYRTVSYRFDPSLTEDADRALEKYFHFEHSDMFYKDLTTGTITKLYAY